MRALFGPAGNSDSFTKRYKSSADAPAWLAEMGLDCYEYQCGRGVNMREETARRIGVRALESGIVMSVHAPYFINLSSIAPERTEKNTQYILQSCAAARQLGGDRVVVHCGGLSGMIRQEALDNTIVNLRHALQALEQAELDDITLCIETMGKINVLGDLEEVLAICRSDRRLLPCIDFGHLNARTKGGLATRQDFEQLFDRMEEALGYDRMRVFHAHFSRIEYSAGGEVRHLTFEDGTYGPDFHPVLDIVRQRAYAPRIICESAGTQAEDAKIMKDYYESIRGDQQ